MLTSFSANHLLSSVLIIYSKYFRLNPTESEQTFHSPPTFHYSVLYLIGELAKSKWCIFYASSTHSGVKRFVKLTSHIYFCYFFQFYLHRFAYSMYWSGASCVKKQVKSLGLSLLMLAKVLRNMFFFFQVMHLIELLKEDEKVDKHW